MVNLEIFGDSGAMSTVAVLLDEVDGVSRVRVVHAARAGHSVVSAAVRPRAVDALLVRCVGTACPLLTSR